MKMLRALPILAFLGVVSCGPSSPGTTAFFDVNVTWTLSDATGKPTTCAALGATTIIATLFQADVTPNVEFTTAMGSCSQGVASDAGSAAALQLTGYSNSPYDLYVQALDSGGKLVGFYKQLGAVPPNVPDNTVISVTATLKPPSPAGCGDGMPAESGKKGCDDFGNNACCNCMPCM